MRDVSANGTFLYKYTFPLRKRKLIHCVLKQLEVGKVCVCVCVCVWFFFPLMLSLLILHCQRVKKEFLILLAEKKLYDKGAVFVCHVLELLISSSWGL